MKYVIKISYSLELEFSDFDDFTAAIAMLIAGGQREMDVVIKEVPND